MERGSIVPSKIEEFEFCGLGEIYSFTKLDPDYAPEGFEIFAPYTVALIKLNEGPMITAQLTDLDRNKPIKIGMKVEMVTRLLRSDGDQGMLIYGYKFRPLLEKLDHLK